MVDSDIYLKIKKVAEQERVNGYADDYVPGGLSDFIENLLDDDDTDQACLIRGITGNYQNSSVTVKKLIIDYLLSAVNDITREASSVSHNHSVNLKGDINGSHEPDKSCELPASDSLLRSVSCLKGIGQRKVELFRKLGVDTVGDLLFDFPVRHLDKRYPVPIRMLDDGMDYLICGKLSKISSNHLSGNRTLIKALISDGTGSLWVTWFNQPWLKQKLYDGIDVTLYGRADFKGNFRNFIPLELKTGIYDSGLGIEPVYHLTKGLNQSTLRQAVREAIDEYGKDIEEIFPDDFIREQNLMPRRDAIKSYHFPDDMDSLKKAGERLIFEEFFLLRMGTLLSHNDFHGKGITMSEGTKESFCSLLPFSLTSAQNRVLDEVYRDMASPDMMNRLLEGDVGSGKTVIAAAALYRGISSGYQAVLMAPTELLATQHYEFISQLFKDSGFRIAFLSGSQKNKEKALILDKLKNHQIDCVIGTHALLEKNVVFNRLGLVVIDEQHRFGVNQRNALFIKGKNPDLLIMTATPIPRTLAMTLFTDLSLSILDQLPPGRKPIRTMVIDEGQENRAVDFIRRHRALGHQIYVICPLVEEMEDSSITAAEALYKEWSEGPLRNCSVGLLHGKMKSADKDGVLQKFRNNEIGVLISTVVIEVGIDVPNAAVMMVKNAERFGLAQLHQIRGRIGRGELPGTCLLQYGKGHEDARERLQVLEKSSDGFKIAEEDLKLRGPGDFFGVRQHGIPELKLADYFRDSELLTRVSRLCDDIYKRDPGFKGPEWSKLKRHIPKTLT